MKKNLSIFLAVISLTAFSEVTYEEAVIENLQDMGSNVSDIQFQLSQFFSSDPDNGYDMSLKDLLYHALYSPDLPAIADCLSSLDASVVDFIYYAYPQYHLTLIDELLNLNLKSQENLDLWYQTDLFSNVESSKESLESIDSHMDNLKISVNQLGDKIDQIIVNAGDSSDLLTDIIEQLQMLNDKTGGSESDFPVENIGYYHLENYGKNVSINHLPLQQLETTGEYNKDVHRMLLNLNRLGSSQNNAALSILTNVQVIATALSQDAEGQDKLEKDLEDKEYQATKAEAELSGITSQNWDSSFTPPRYLSDVHGRLSIGLSDPGLPSEITVMDKFYYETAYFTLEIDPLSFQIPKPLVDLANYGRIVFGFVYWTLTFFLALYLFRLWVRLYMYVSNTLINR